MIAYVCIGLFAFVYLIMVLYIIIGCMDNGNETLKKLDAIVDVLKRKKRKSKDEDKTDK